MALINSVGEEISSLLQHQLYFSNRDLSCINETKTNNLAVYATNSKGTQCEGVDNSLWSFLDVRLPVLCQTLLMATCRPAPNSTHELDKQTAIARPKRMSKVTMVKSAKCQVDLTTDVHVKNRAAENDFSQTILWKNDYCDRNLEKPNALNEFEKSTERLQLESSRIRPWVTSSIVPTGERSLPGYATKVTINVKPQTTRPTREMRATVQACNEENSAKINRRTTKKHESTNSLRAVEETSVNEDEQTNATPKHSPTSSITVDNGDGHINDAQVTRHTPNVINYRVYDADEEQDSETQSASEFQMQSQTHETKANGTLKWSSNKEKEGMRHKTEQHSKPKRSKNKPQAEETRLTEMMAQDVYTPNVPILFDNKSMQTDITTIGESVGNYDDDGIPICNIKYTNRNETDNSRTGRNFEQNKKALQNKQETRMRKENTRRTNGKSEISEQKLEQATGNKEHQDITATNRYHNTDPRYQVESTHYEPDVRISNNMDIEPIAYAHNKTVHEKEMNKYGENINGKKQAKRKPCYLSHNVSDDEWKEEDDNIFNDLKNRSQTKSHKTEEQDNYENSIINQTSATHVHDKSASKEQMERNNSHPTSSKTAQHILPKNYGLSTDEEFEIKVKQIENSNGINYGMNVNTNRCPKQNINQDFHTKSITDNSSKSNKKEHYQPKEWNLNENRNDLDDTSPSWTDSGFYNKQKDDHQNERKKQNNSEAFDDYSATDENIKRRNKLVSSFDETHNCSEIDTDQMTGDDESCGNLPSIQNISHLFEQRQSERETELSATEIDAKETDSKAEMNHKSKELHITKHWSLREMFANSTALHASVHNNIAANNISTVGGLKHGTRDEKDNIVCQDRTTNREVQLHLDTTEMQGNSLANKQTAKYALNNFIQQEPLPQTINETDPNGSGNKKELNPQTQFTHQTQNNNKNYRHTASSTPTDLLPWSDDIISKQQPPGKFSSGNVKDITGSVQFAAERKTSATPSIITSNTSCKTDNQIRLSVPTDQICLKENGECIHLDGRRFVSETLKTDKRLTRRFSSGERKISQTDMFCYSVPGSKRRSRSESFTRRCALSREWQLLTITTTEEMTIIARPKPESDKEIQENAEHHQKISTSCNQQPIINTDSQRFQDCRMTTIANVELPPKLFQTAKTFVPDTSKIETDICDVENCDEESSVLVTPRQDKSFPGNTNTEGSQILAPLYSDMKTCSSDSNSNSKALSNSEISIDTKDDTIGSEQYNFEILRKSKHDKEHKKQINETINEGQEPAVEKTILKIQILPESATDILYANTLHEKCCVTYATEKESQEEQVKARIGNDKQLNDRLSRTNPVKLASQNSVEDEESPMKLEMTDAMVQCDLTEYIDADTQTNYRYDISKQSEQVAEHKCKESNNIESLTFPMLLPTRLKLPDTDKQTANKKMSNNSTAKLTETILDASQCLISGITINSINNHRLLTTESDTSGDFLDKMLIGYIWYSKRTGIGIKGVCGRIINRSNSLNDLCTVGILPTTNSVQSTKLENQEKATFSKTTGETTFSETTGETAK